MFKFYRLLPEIRIIHLNPLNPYELLTFRYRNVCHIFFVDL